MSIKKIQVTRVIEGTVKRYLLSGRYPALKTITHHFNEWLRDNSPGAPSFRPKKILRKSKSDSKKYNENLDMIATDINDAYEATIQHGKSATSNFNFIETERGKISHNLTSIENQIEEFLMMAKNLDHRYFDGQTISFENMNRVDGLNTTALVNVDKREVTLFENSYRSNRVILDGAEARFRVLKPSDHNAILEPFNNAFDDNANTAWWHVVKAQQLDNEMKAELIVLFNQEEEINHIDFVPHNSKEVYVSLEYTTDGSTFMSLMDNGQIDRVTEETSWNFQPVRARGIRFIFTKTMHDDRSAGMYQYYFGAKNIGIYKKSYISESVLYTEPIEFNEKVRKLSLSAIDVKPHNTDIRYEIAIYRDYLTPKEHIWYPVSSVDDSTPAYPTTLDLNVTQLRTAETSSAIDSGEVINGMKVFKLIGDTGRGIISEEVDEDGNTVETFEEIIDPKLFRGVNQWKCESTYQPFNGDIPLNSQWERIEQHSPQAINLAFSMKGNRLECARPEGSPNNFYRFTICLNSDQEQGLPLSLNVLQSMTTGHRKRLGSYSVYLNRQRLTPSNDEVTLDLIEGWNEIQILYHWGDMELREDVSLDNLPVSTYLGKMDFTAMQARAEISHMTYVNANSLYYNISPNNKNHFAIKERQIVLNYLPVNTLFQLIYESKDQNRENNAILIRALLERDENNQHITPTIKRINLLGK